MSNWKGLILAVTEDMEYLFAPRHLLEENDKYRQLIPYILFRCGGKYACFQRVKGQEKRLTNKYTIGVGGHIDIDDFHAVMRLFKNIDTVDSENVLDDILYTAFLREAFEETGMYLTLNQYNKIGVIKSTDTPVDCVHLGVVFEAGVDEAELVASMARLSELEINLVGFKTKDELLAMIETGNADENAPQLESWSRIVATKIL